MVQTRRGVAVLVVILVVVSLVLVGVVAYKYGGGSLGIIDQYSQEAGIDDIDLTDGNEVSDIEEDLDSTDVDDLDSEVIGVSAEVE